MKSLGVGAVWLSTNRPSCISPRRVAGIAPAPPVRGTGPEGHFLIGGCRVELALAGVMSQEAADKHFNSKG
jgi:hypothetical protein